MRIPLNMIPVAIAAALLIHSTQTAEAGVILQPTGASTDLGTLNAGPNFQEIAMVNQSGLLTSYTSGVTDFDAYLAGTPKHDQAGGRNSWVSSFAGPLGDVDFELGGLFTIESMALWPYLAGGLEVIGFDLFADDNAAFSSPTSLGSFVATPFPATGLGQADVFTFAPTTASHIRLTITSNNGHADLVGIGEVAFEEGASTGAAVPEPSSLALLAIGACGLVAARRRRKPVAGDAPDEASEI